MPFARSLLFAVTFYAVTAFWVLVGIVAAMFGRRPTHAIVLSWVDCHHWLAERVLGIRTRVIGAVPSGAWLIAVKHQSMFETLEMIRLARLPVVVIKKELADIPLFGLMTRRYGVVPVERSAGAKALRAMVAEGREAVASGRSVLIFPEGTRVPAGETPTLRPGFAGLYRALGLPVIPVALDSGLLWGSGFIKNPGTVTFLIGEMIPAGLRREDIESRVHDAINALELAPEGRS
jgi:1-acyl-sn-glycerol-3-phosphate acyltransferase